MDYPTTFYKTMVLSMKMIQSYDLEDNNNNILVPTGDQHNSVNHPVVELPPAGLIFSIRLVASMLQPGPSLVAEIELLNILRKFKLLLYAFKEIY